MFELVNLSLGYNYFAANRTMLTFCKSRFGASGSYCFIDYFGVPKCINNSLLYNNFITYGAMLTFCKSCFGASGSYYNINNFGVIFFLSNGNPKKTTGSAIAPGTTDLFITYIYRLVTDDVNKYYNVASAIGIIIFLVCSFISIILYNKTGAVAKEDQFQ